MAVGSMPGTLIGTISNNVGQLTLWLRVVTPPPPLHWASGDGLWEIGGSTPSARVGKQLTYVWEPREAWKPDEVRELCEELGLVHGVDPFQQPPTTAPGAYFRLHGRKGYRYSCTDLDLDQLMEMAKSRSPVYVLFNNVSMLADAGRFQRLAQGR